MKAKLLALAVLFCAVFPAVGFGGDLGVGIGLRVGTARLEGDIANPRFGPMVSGTLKISPTPFLAFTGDLGFQHLTLNGHPVFRDLRTTLVPFELAAEFNFLPFSKVNPFVTLGGGGTYWQAQNNGRTLVVAGKKQNGLDSFLKVGGGLEFRVAPKVGVSVGATYRYSLSDAFDQIWSGDEKDQTIDVFAGFTYYFGRGPRDRDHDGIPDDRDLMPDIAEDRDGYMDHDGIPEKNPDFLASTNPDVPWVNGQSSPTPVVLHSIVTHAEAGKDIPVRVSVYSEAALKVVAAIYRPVGSRSWQVVKLQKGAGREFEGRIPGEAVTADGLEYCVVAVDEAVKGIGYAGLPSKPIEVEVLPKGTAWRILGGVVGAAAVGTAAYLVGRKQK